MSEKQMRRVEPKNRSVENNKGKPVNERQDGLMKKSAIVQEVLVAVLCLSLAFPLGSLGFSSTAYAQDGDPIPSGAGTGSGTLTGDDLRDLLQTASDHFSEPRDPFEGNPFDPLGLDGNPDGISFVPPDLVDPRLAPVLPRLPGDNFFSNTVNGWLENLDGEVMIPVRNWFNDEEIQEQLVLLNEQAYVAQVGRYGLLYEHLRFDVDHEMTRLKARAQNPESSREFRELGPVERDEVVAFEDGRFETEWKPAVERLLSFPTEPLPQLPQVIDNSIQEGDIQAAINPPAGYDEDDFERTEEERLEVIIPFEVPSEDLDPRLARARQDRYTPRTSHMDHPPEGMFFPELVMARYIDSYFTQLGSLIQVRSLAGMDAGSGWMRRWDLRVPLSLLRKISGDDNATRMIQATTGRDFSNLSTSDGNNNSIMVYGVEYPDDDPTRFDEAVVLLNYHPRFVQGILNATSIAIQNNEDALFALYQLWSLTGLYKNWTEIFFIKGRAPHEDEIPQEPEIASGKFAGKLPFDEVRAGAVRARKEPALKKALKIKLNPVPAPEDEIDALALSVQEKEEVTFSHDAFVSNVWIPHLRDELGMVLIDYDLVSGILAITDPEREPDPNGVAALLESFEKTEVTGLAAAFEETLDAWPVALSELPEDEQARQLRWILADAKAHAILTRVETMAMSPDPTNHYVVPIGEGLYGVVARPPELPARQLAVTQQELIKELVEQAKADFAEGISPAYIAALLEEAREVAETEVYEEHRRQFITAVIGAAREYKEMEEEREIDNIEVDIKVAFYALNDNDFWVNMVREDDYLEDEAAGISPVVMKILRHVVDGGSFPNCQTRFNQVVDGLTQEFEEALAHVVQADQTSRQDTTTTSGATIGAGHRLLSMLYGQGTIVHPGEYDGLPEDLLERRSEFKRKDALDLLHAGWVLGLVDPLTEENPETRLLGELHLEDYQKEWVHEALLDDIEDAHQLLTLDIGPLEKPLYTNLVRAIDAQDLADDSPEAFVLATEMVDEAIAEQLDLVEEKIATLGNAESFEDLPEETQRILVDSNELRALLDASYPFLTRTLSDMTYDVYTPGFLEMQVNYALHDFVGPMFLSLILPPLLGRLGQSRFFVGTVAPRLTRMGAAPLATLVRRASPYFIRFGEGVHVYITGPVMTGFFAIILADLYFKTRGVLGHYGEAQEAEEFFYTGVGQGTSIYNRREWRRSEAEFWTAFKMWGWKAAFDMLFIVPMIRIPFTQFSLFEKVLYRRLSNGLFRMKNRAVDRELHILQVEKDQVPAVLRSKENVVAHVDQRVAVLREELEAARAAAGRGRPVPSEKYLLDKIQVAKESGQRLTKLFDKYQLEWDAVVQSLAADFEALNIPATYNIQAVANRFRQIEVQFLEGSLHTNRQTAQMMYDRAKLASERIISQIQSRLNAFGAHFDHTGRAPNLARIWEAVWEGRTGWRPSTSWWSDIRQGLNGTTASWYSSSPRVVRYVDRDGISRVVVARDLRHARHLSEHGVQPSASSRTTGTTSEDSAWLRDFINRNFGSSGGGGR